MSAPATTTSVVTARPPWWARHYTFTGTVVGLVFLWLSLTPSLLPRGPLFQDWSAAAQVRSATRRGSSVSGWRASWPPGPSPPPPRWAWLVLVPTATAVHIWVVWTIHGWQDQFAT